VARSWRTAGPGAGALFAKLDKNGMRRLGVGEKLPERIANAGPIADLGKSLDQRGVNRDSARAFMQKL
jgi:hypothetical protein